jgi:hypothetical protein
LAWGAEGAFFGVVVVDGFFAGPVTFEAVGLFSVEVLLLFSFTSAFLSSSVNPFPQVLPFSEGFHFPISVSLSFCFK